MLQTHYGTIGLLITGAGLGISDLQEILKGVSFVAQSLLSHFLGRGVSTGVEASRAPADSRFTFSMTSAV
jgi:outer membrane protein assembly factor BamA